MKTEVELPDGSIIEFPDGVGQEEIGRVVRRQVRQATSGDIRGAVGEARGRADTERTRARARVNADPLMRQTMSRRMPFGPGLAGQDPSLPNDPAADPATRRRMIRDAATQPLPDPIVPRQPGRRAAPDRTGEAERYAVRRALTRVLGGSVEEDPALENVLAFRDPARTAYDRDESLFTTFRRGLGVVGNQSIGETINQAPEALVRGTGAIVRRNSPVGPGLGDAVERLGYSALSLADLGAYTLESGARRVVGDGAVDNVNEFAARNLGTNPGGAAGSLAGTITALNNVAPDPMLAEAGQAYADSPSFLSGAGRFAGRILSDPVGMVNTLVEQGAPLVAGFGLGRVAMEGAERAGTSIAARIGAQSVAARLATSPAARMAAFGGGMGAGSTLGAVPFDIAGAMQDPAIAAMPEQERVAAAVDRGTRATAARLVPQTIAGALLPLRVPGRLGRGAVGVVPNVALQGGIQGTGGVLGEIEARRATGQPEASTAELAAEFGGEFLTAPVDLATGAIEARRSAPGFARPAEAPPPREFTVDNMFQPGWQPPETQAPRPAPPPAAAAPRAPQPPAAATPPTPDTPRGGLPDPGPLAEGEAYVSTARGDRIRSRFEVVDAGQLQSASGGLQNRDRTRGSTDLQVQDIVSRFDPTRLGESAEADRGAPIVGDDGVIESGNGRVMALNRIYDAHPDQAAAYRSFIEQQGYSTEGMERPVLIRRRVSPLDEGQRRQFVVDANRSAILEMSPTERARSDAGLLDGDMLALYRGGEVSAAANREFVMSFQGRLPATEQGGLIDSSNQLSQAGVSRIEAALMARAYENPEVLEKLLEARDNNIRSIGGAMLDNSGQWGSLRAAVASGDIAPEFDVTPQLVEAARIVSDARNAGTKIGDLLSQGGMFGDIDPVTEQFIRAFYDAGLRRAAGRDAIGDIIAGYVRRANEQTSAPRLIPTDTTSPEAILRGLLDERGTGPTGDMFAEPAPKPTRSSSALAADIGSPPPRSNLTEALRPPKPAGKVDEDRSSLDYSRPGKATSPPSPYDPDVMEKSFTNRASIYDTAAIAAGHDPVKFRLLAPGEQIAELTRVVGEAFGVTVTVKPGMPARLAIDQMLDAYQNLQGMAFVLGLPTKAIGLNQSLSLELRKSARFLGAYSRADSKIILPGRSNSFAHEWGHAVDYHLLAMTSGPGKGLSGAIRQRGGQMTDGALPQSRDVGEAFVDLLNVMFFDKADQAAQILALEAKIAASRAPATQAKLQAQIARIKAGASQTRAGRTAFYRNAKSMDGGDYWASPTEMLARSFEAYVSHRVEVQGLTTEFIGKGDASYLSNADERFAKTFPKGDERDLIFAAYDVLFDQLAAAELLASGRAASMPDTVTTTRADLFRPPVLPKTSWFARMLANEMGAFEDLMIRRAKAREGRPANPKGWMQKLQDFNSYFTYGMTSRWKMLARRYNSPTLLKMHDLVHHRSGSGDFTPRGLIQATRMRENSYLNLLDRALDRAKIQRAKTSGFRRDLTADEARTVRDLMIGEKVPGAPANLVTLASELRALHDKAWHDANAVGLNVGYARNGYMRRIPDVPKILGDETGFLPQAEKAYGIQWDNDPEVRGKLSRADYAAKAAGDWLARIRYSGPDEFDKSGSASGFTKKRTLPPEADKLLEDYYVNDPLEVTALYLRQLASRVEYVERFGPDGKKLNEMFRQAAAEGVRAEDLDVVADMLNVVTGRAATRLPAVIQSGVAAVRVIWGTIAFLPRATLSSLAESAAMGIVLENPKYGVMNLASLVEGTFGTAPAKERREIARFLGMVSTAGANAVLAERFGGTWSNDTRWDRIASNMFRNSGLTAYTRAQHTHIIAPAHAYLDSLAGRIVGGKIDGWSGKQREDAIARYRELGIRDPERFAQEIRETGRLPTIDELAAGQDGENAYAYDWATAVDRLKVQTIQSPSGIDRPRAANTNVGSLAYGIMSFLYAQWNNIIKGTATRFYERGKRSGWTYASAKMVGGVLPSVLLLMLGNLIPSMLREFIYNRERWEERKRNGTLGRDMAALTASRTFGTPLDPWMQAFSGLKYQRDITAAPLGPALGNIFQNVQAIAMPIYRNSRTNSTEYDALRGAYRLGVGPVIGTGLSAIPAGPVLGGFLGLGTSFVTAPVAGDEFAEMFVGEKDSTRRRRRAAANRR